MLQHSRKPTSVFDRPKWYAVVLTHFWFHVTGSLRRASVARGSARSSALACLDWDKLHVV